MKNLIIISLIGLSVLAHSQPLNRTFEKANGAINLLGVSTIDRLKQEPFQEWYQESYNEHEVNSSLLGSVTLPDSITIFMGTWCGDSRREVPKFIKILEEQNYDLNKLKIICLNTGFQNYKQAPEREERGVNIHRVPTFILHGDDGSELGRIVEEPVVSLEQDLVDLINKKPYETVYPVANDMIENFKNYSIKELRKMKPALLKKYKEMTVGIYELSTYGYILWTSWDLMKAEFLFELNTKLYPNEAYTHSTLARFKSGMGKEKEAVKSVKEGLKIDPKNEGLLSMKESLME